MQTVQGLQQNKLEKTVADGECKKKYPGIHGKQCAEYKKRSETTYICKFCVVPLHKGSCFERYHSSRNYWDLYVRFLQYWIQEFNLYRES
jgi:hypothetical protein